MRKIAIHCMCYNPDTMRDMFLATIDNLSDMAPWTTIVLSVNGDKFTADDINHVVEVIEGAGFELFYHRDVEQTTLLVDKQLLKMRQNSLDLWDSLSNNDSVAGTSDRPKYMLLLDDDMKFGASNPDSPSDIESSGGQYLRSVHYMDNHPRCGVVCHASYMGVKNRPGMTYQGINQHGQNISMQRGILLRNIPEIPNMLADREFVDNLYGGADEIAYAAARVSRGYYVARATCGRTRHKVSSTFGQESDRHGFGWLSWDIIDEHPLGIRRLCKSFYNFEFNFDRRATLPYYHTDLLCGIPREETYEDYRGVSTKVYGIDRGDEIDNLQGESDAM